jgi:hypothetical protein
MLPGPIMTLQLYRQDPCFSGGESARPEESRSNSRTPEACTENKARGDNAGESRHEDARPAGHFFVAVARGVILGSAALTVGEAKARGILRVTALHRPAVAWGSRAALADSRRRPRMHLVAATFGSFFSARGIFAGVLVPTPSKPPHLAGMVPRAHGRASSVRREIFSATIFVSDGVEWKRRGRIRLPTTSAYKEC